MSHCRRDDGMPSDGMPYGYVAGVRFERSANLSVIRMIQRHLERKREKPPRGPAPAAVVREMRPPPESIGPVTGWYRSRKKFRVWPGMKITRGVLAALVLLPGLSLAGPASLRLEAEGASLTGVEKATERKGFSGTGYVRGFDEKGDRVEFRFTAKAGLYELTVGYATPHGKKGYEIQVNGERNSGMFPRESQGFRRQTAGKFLLEEGENTITIEGGWNWYEIDYVELSPAVLLPLDRPLPSTADRLAGREARALLKFLAGIYGRKTLAGQQDFSDIEYVKSVCGRDPAVACLDFMDYSPSRVEHGADPKGLVEKAVGWAKENGIVSMCWHWNAPADLIDREGKEWWAGFYTEATTFDLESALRDPAGERYRLLIRDMDVIARELVKFQEAGVPVLWRPLHEAEGGWFWWGARGPRPFVQLWRIMFRRFTEHHGLHNLLWVYSPPSGGASDRRWYPGGSYVDIVGVDHYTDPSSSMSGLWESLRKTYGGRKLLALAECGAPPLPDKMRSYQVRWAYFSVWSDEFIRHVPAETLRAVYADEDIITRDELPVLPHRGE